MGRFNFALDKPTAGTCPIQIDGHRTEKGVGYRFLSPPRYPPARRAPPQLIPQ
jgi:hypothetical protein